MQGLSRRVAKVVCRRLKSHKNDIKKDVFRIVLKIQYFMAAAAGVTGVFEVAAIKSISAIWKI
jgi:hypothetical protein